MAGFYEDVDPKPYNLEHRSCRWPVLAARREGQVGSESGERTIFLYIYLYILIHIYYTV